MALTGAYPVPERAAKVCPRCMGQYSGRRCLVCQRRRMDALDARLVRDPVKAASYVSVQWVAASSAYLRDHPWCEAMECKRAGIAGRQMATEVDHVDGCGPGGDRGLDPTNFQSLCPKHHSAKTSAHDGGMGNRRTAPDDPRRRG